MSDAIDWKARCEKAEKTIAHVYELAMTEDGLADFDADSIRDAWMGYVSCEELDEQRARAEKAEEDLATALRKDSIKTKEINILVRENREQKAELERAQKLLGETMDYVPSELRTRIVSAVADAQAKGPL